MKEVNKKKEYDKYYTPNGIANHCWDIVDREIGLDNITRIIEPSVGAGAFCNYKKRKPDIMIDIKPEIEGAIQDDYIVYAKFKTEYQKGTLVIGNPPFGERNALSIKFFKASIRIADYIAFILPIGQLNNNNRMNEFDLIYSEDLGEAEYSGVKLHCCFNIYKRPERFKKYNDTTIISSDITILRNDRESVGSDIVNKKYRECKNYSIRMCYWGNATAGVILNDTEKEYSAEYKIIIDDRNKDKQAIIDFIKTYDWNGNCQDISAKKITKQDILREVSKRFNINQVEESKPKIIDFL